MGPAGERKAKCCSRRQSASPAQKSPPTSSPERTTNTTSNKQNQPDIVISASPRFTRKKDFKAAGRLRSKDKNNKKKPVSMDDSDMPREAITQSEANEDIESVQESDGTQEESSQILSVTEVVQETLDEDGVCVSSTTHIQTITTDGQTISAVMQESKVSNLDSQTIIGNDEGQAQQLQEVHTKEERGTVVAEPEFVERVAYTVGSQEEIAEDNSTHPPMEHQAADSPTQLQESQQLETNQSNEELKGEGATSCDETERQLEGKTIKDSLTNVEYVSQQQSSVASEEMSNHVSEVSMYYSANSSLNTEQEVEVKSDYTCSENIQTSFRKPSSLALDKNGDGSSFWTHSARNSVISSPSRDGLTDSLGSPTESVRDILIQKRVSLTHTPDIVRVFDKEFQQASRDVHEFQKVKNELKHVEEQTLSSRKISQASDFCKTQSIVSESFESTTSCVAQEEEAEALQVLDTVVTEAANKVRSRAMSKDMIVDLIPGPVVNMQRKSVKEEDKKVSKQVSKSNTSATEIKKKNSEQKKAENKMVEQKNARNTQMSSQSGGTVTVAKKNAVKKEKSKTTMIASQSAQMTAEKSQQSVKSLGETNQSGSTTTDNNVSVVQKKSNTRQTRSAGKESNDSKTNKGNEKRSVSKSGPSDKKSLLQSPNLIKQVKASTTDKTASKKQVASSNGSLESPALLKDINGGSKKSITSRTASPSGKTLCSDSKSSSPVPTTVRSLSPEGKPPTTSTRSSSVSERTMSPERKTLHTRSPSVVSGRSNSPAGKSPSRNGSSVNGLDEKDSKTKSSSKSSLTSGKSGSIKRQESKVREKTIKKEDMLFDKNKNGENKENGFAVKREPPKSTVSNAKGGYLAPTKSWISYMGDPIDLKSRSPSPAAPERKRSTTVPRKITDRSPSPRRRLRESSTESEGKDKSKKPVICPPTRKMMEKDPNLPTVKRSTSVRSKAQTNGDLKRSDSMKKTITNGVDKDLGGTKTPQENSVAKSETQLSEKQKASSIRNKQRDVSSSSMTRKTASNKSENKSQININSVESATQAKSASGPKKVPPPVAPKPSSTNTISSEYQVSDVSRQEDSSLLTTAAANSITSQEITTTSTSHKASSQESSNIASAQTVVKKSEVNTATVETSEQVENICESSENHAESGVEETSITATQAIQKFETQSKVVSNSSDVAVSSHLLQETVSSRLKKVSGEEFAGERKSSIVKTGEVTSNEKENAALEESKTVSESSGENNKIVKSIARAKSFSAKKSSTTDSSATAKKTSVLVSSGSSSVIESASLSNTTTSKASSAATSISSAVKKSSVATSSNTISSKKSSVSASSTDTSNTTEVSKNLISSSKANISSSKVEESSSQSTKVISSTEKKTSEKVSSQSTSSASTNSIRSSQLQRSESKGLKQVTAKKGGKSQETNGCETQLKTTMVVRLHPGQSRRLSAYMDQQGQEGCDVTRRSWVGDVQDNNTTQSICGLEISFSSVPQDIDIKLIPGNSNCAVDNKEPGPDTNKAEAGPTQSSSEDPLETEPDLNKTRQ